jgi:hypothetical protein
VGERALRQDPRVGGALRQDPRVVDEVLRQDPRVREEILVTASVVPSSPIIATLMKEALSSSET